MIFAVAKEKIKGATAKAGYWQRSVEMTAINEGLLSGWQENEEELERKISLASLSELTGFPVEFIKKELLIEREPISMRELRESMMVYLESSAAELLS